MTTTPCRRPGSAQTARSSSTSTPPPGKAASACTAGPHSGCRLLRSDDAASAHQDAAAQGVQFRGGTGSCVIDDYLTRIGAHHYQEIACLVQGRTSASVIVAAAPAATWAQARPLLFRAVAAYLVR